MSSSPLLPRLRSLARSWPTDPLRPELPFSRLLLSRATSLSAGPSQDPSAAASLRRELFALECLRADRFKNKYPVSQRLTRPQSNPDYYDKLLAEIAEAPGRSRLGRFLNSFKGWVRWD